MNGTKVAFALIAMVVCLAAAADITRPSSFAYWKMDRLVDGKVPDETGNGNSLELGEGCSLAETALSGTGLLYDGTTNAWARFAYPALTARTVSLWFRRDVTDGTAEGNSYVHLFGQFGGMRALYNFAQPGAAVTDGLTVYCNGTNPSILYSGTKCVFNREAWTHVVLTYAESDGNGTVTVYRNGLKVSNITQDLAGLTAGVAAGNGCLGNQGVRANRPICGVLDEVKVASSAWTDAEVLNEYLATQKELDPLVGRWKMESLVDGKVPAAAGTKDLTAGAGVSLTNGVNGSALWFDGTQNAKTWFVVDEPLFDFTFMGWVNQSWLQSQQVVSDNSAPRLFACGSYATLGSSVTSLALSYTAHGTTLKADPAMRAGKESWSHLTVMEEVSCDGSGVTNCTMRIFVNGRLTAETTVPYAGLNVSGGKNFNIGSNGGNRPFHGCLDDVRVYRRALTAAEVQAAYRGVADSSAGDDFAVAAETATLVGRLNLAGAQPLQPNAAAKVAWSLVSAPDGGEDAAILAPANPQTRVTLPVVGDYVFRMSVSGDVTDSDEVTVTRVAPTGSSPTVAVAATSATVTSPEPAELTATVSDAGANLSWRKVSGPGGVYFEPTYTASTKALFTAAGTYVLACRAENGGGVAEGTVTIVVEGSDGAVFPTSGLVHYWDFDTTSVGDSSTLYPRTVDRVTGTQVTYGNQASISNLTFKAQAGYGFSPVNDNDYLNLGTGDGDTTAATYSFWQYIDGTKDTTSSRILRSGNIEIWVLNSMDTSSKGVYFRAYLNDATGKNYYWDTDYVATQVLKGSPRNRWAHIAVTFDKATTSDKTAIDSKVKVYVDGTAIEMKPQARADGFSFAPKTCGTIYLGYTLAKRFPPGITDELRIFDRLLSVSEIRRLAADVTAVNRAPIVELTAARQTISSRRQVTLSPVEVFDDDQPTPISLTAAWEFVSGDAAKISYETTSAGALSVRAKKPGSYVFRLRANDGARESVSEPFTVEVIPAGLTVIVR